MIKRIITSIVAIGVLLPALIFSGTIVFPIAIAIVGIISLYELFKCIGVNKKALFTIPAYISAIVFPFLTRYMEGSQTAAISTICALMYLIYTFAHIIWSHGKFAFNDGLTAYVLVLYILFALNAIIYIRDYNNIGKYIYLLIFIGAWITDIFAYFTGVFFGKHKLIEDVSPKKTIEGSIGGTLFCALSFVAFGLVVDYFFNMDSNIIFLALSGIIIAIISQIGDLIMSVVKRHYGIKDFGKIFPGHGGVLDRFDSIFAVTLGICAVCMFMTLTNIQII